jgi:hypothetical protein
MNPLFDTPVWTTKPAFVNAEQTKWWPDVSLTDYAIKPDIHDVTLPHASVWYVEKPNGYQTRLLVIEGAIEFESTKLEDMAVHIDILKTAKRFETAEKERAK